MSLVMTSVSDVAWNWQPASSSPARSIGALTRLPLWASASVPHGVSSMKGCAFARCAPPIVEYRTCPMPTPPGSRARRSGVKTCATSPMSLTRCVCEPSQVAMPALSWPRCCSAYRPRCTYGAAAAWVRIPKTPHSSRSLSHGVVIIGASRLLRDRVPRLQERRHGHVEPRPALRGVVGGHDETIAAHGADDLHRHGQPPGEVEQIGHPAGPDRPDDAADRFAKQRGVRPAGTSHRDARAEPRRRGALRERDRETAFGAVVRGCEQTFRHRLPHAPDRSRYREEIGLPQPAGDPAVHRLEILGAVKRRYALAQQDDHVAV